MTKRRNLLAVIMIVIGILMLLSRVIYIPYEFNILLFGGIFILGYFMSGNHYTNRKPILLVFGFIISVVTLNGILKNLFNITKYEGPLFFILLAIGFLSIHLISSGKTDIPGKYVQSWALRSGIISFFIGVMIFVLSIFDWKITLIVINNIWPIGLILFGISIILNNRKIKIKTKYIKK